MRPDRGQFVIASLRRATCRVFERANYTSSLSLSLSLSLAVAYLARSICGSRDRGASALHATTASTTEPGA